MITSLTRASALFFAGMLALAGCSGKKGDPGQKGDPGEDLTLTAKPESCAVCHSSAGANHQASYNELYQDGVIAVTNVNYSNDGTNDTVTFKLTKAGVNLDCTKVGSFGVYFTQWDGTQFPSNVSLYDTRNNTPDVTYDGAGGCTVTQPQSTNGDLGLLDGLIVVYGYDELVQQIGHIRMAKFPFAAIIETKGPVNYASAANVSGCEKCHTRPFLKHAYIYGDVGGKEFYTCKACHYDNRDGGHEDWQVLVDDPVRYAQLDAIPLSTTEELKYAYKARLMNDVHMSHAMEFPYPQTMANCVTCHAGKLGSILTDANYTLTTCKSCHPVTGPANPAYVDSKRAPALLSIVPDNHKAWDLYENPTGTPPPNCNICHSTGIGAPVFSAIHSGYDKKIYDAVGAKYSEIFTVSIDSASLSGNVLTIDFHAEESPDDPQLAVTDIAPTVIVGLYGYDTKHFIVGAHNRDANNERLLEYAVGTTHPRFTTVSAAGGTWQVTANLTDWADMISDGRVKRAEIAILPTLKNADGVTLALKAPSRTFDLTANAFDDNYFKPVVDVTRCNSCHDALATTFHSPNRGGNVTVCRLCHVTLNGGSHLEMQSRSIESYVHAIHSFQPFDIGDIDFTDPVETVHYEHHIEFIFPTFGITNCEACHNPGTYEVPDQSKSLPGILSAADVVTTADRNIGAVPSYVTGPASRACGSCHRAELIKDDAAGGLAAFNEHTKSGGYMLEDGPGVLDAAIEKIMSMFQ